MLCRRKHGKNIPSSSLEAHNRFMFRLKISEYFHLKFRDARFLQCITTKCSLGIWALTKSKEETKPALLHRTVFKCLARRPSSAFNPMATCHFDMTPRVVQNKTLLGSNMASRGCPIQQPRSIGQSVEYQCVFGSIDAKRCTSHGKELGDLRSENMVTVWRFRISRPTGFIRSHGQLDIVWQHSL